jgi:CubicO group peptidase (beta-lactamase class C family)
MARFEIAMLSDRLVSRATRDLMWTPLKPSDGGEDNYGLGFGTGHELGVFDVGHSGGQQGTSTMMMMVPEKHLGVIVLANEDEVHVSELARTVLKSLLSNNVGQQKQ